MPLKPTLGMEAPVEKTDDETSAIADALEMLLGSRPSDEQVEAFCLAAALGVQKHEAGEY